MPWHQYIKRIANAVSLSLCLCQGDGERRQETEGDRKTSGKEEGTGRQGDRKAKIKKDVQFNMN